MAEDLTILCGNLSLSIDESQEVEIEKQKPAGLSTRGKLCLVGKLIVDQLIGKESIKRTLVKGWRPSGFLTFKVLGDNLFGYS